MPEASFHFLSFAIGIPCSTTLLFCGALLSPFHNDVYGGCLMCYKSGLVPLLSAYPGALRQTSFGTRTRFPEKRQPPLHSSQIIRTTDSNFHLSSFVRVYYLASTNTRAVPTFTPELG